MVLEQAQISSLPAMLLQQAERLGDKAFLWSKCDKTWRSWSWRAASAEALSLAAGLKSLGLARGDRVLLVSENRPEWVIADFAIMAAGGVTVPAYITNTATDHLHMINNAEATFVVVSTRALAEKILAAAWQAATPPTVICMELPRIMQSPDFALLSWADATALGRGGEDAIRADLPSIGRDDVACLIYTSGTGGAPRGVMLTHGNLLSNASGAIALLADLGITDHEVFLSFLPLSHAYEHTAGLIFPMLLGAEIYYAESLEALGANMAEVKPTVMTTVPRLCDNIRARLQRTVLRGGGFRARLLSAALTLGTRRYHQNGKLGPVDSLIDLILTRLVRRKIALRFGGRLKALVSGGAPLAFDVGLFFTALGIRTLQGYGQTEASPVIAASRPLAIKLDTVGPPLPGVEVRIAEDGEILVRGPSVMKGYWRDDVGTRRVIKDGWLHTGDIGEVDGHGLLRITDRKRDIIVNSGGDNIAPQRIESFLTLQPEIGQAMVYGDRRPHLVAVLVPSPDWVEEWKRRHARRDPLQVLIADPGFRADMGKAVERVNRTVSNIEKIRRFSLTAEAFSIENEQLTPTLKIRRHVIRQIYGAALDGLYGDQTPPAAAPAKTPVKSGDRS